MQLPRATRPIIHCDSENQARRLLDMLQQRFAECKLELNPQKTKIVYCKDANRRGNYPEQNFDFLGHTFRPRGAMNRSEKMFVSFIPAVSAKATKAMQLVLRQWKFLHRCDLALEELVRWLQPIVRGWVNYYGRFNPAALHQALRMVDELLIRWARRKYKGFKKRPMGAWDWLKRLNRLRKNSEWMAKDQNWGIENHQPTLADRSLGLLARSIFRTF